jgi:hypothetical protein
LTIGESLQAFARIDCPPSKNSLNLQCAHVKPREVVTQIDNEYFWSNNHTVLIVNKKYCEIRSTFNAEVKKVYIGK